MFVEKPEEYLFSSARNYAELPFVLDVILETPELKTYGMIYTCGFKVQIRASGNISRRT